MKSFKIIAELADGKVATTDGFLPIDSILSVAWMKLNEPDVFYNSNPDSMSIEEMIIPDLPLEKRSRKHEWYWSSSFAVYQTKQEFTKHWHKRFDKEYEKFLNDRKKVYQIGSGRFKSYRMPLPGDLTERIVWYAYGNPDKCLKLLYDAAITNIGKKRSQGYGLVKEWIVEETKEDYSEFGPNNELMRSMLVVPKIQGEFSIRLAGIRPPYWHQDNQFRCVVPVRKEMDYA